MVGGQGGDGGHSFYSEPRKIFGGPDGGNGGDGGHVVLKGKSEVKSVLSPTVLSFNTLVPYLKKKKAGGGER